MRKLIAVLAALLATGLTVSPAVAAPSAKANTFASCRASGHKAHCQASGKTIRPARVIVHIKARPRQRVSVRFEETCKKGYTASEGFGWIHGRTPIRTRLPLGFTRPGYCTVSLKGHLRHGGHVHIWLTATHWRHR